MIVEGAGHSESDTILFVPDSEVMCAGDRVVVRAHPDLATSDPGRWLEALQRIEKARPKAIVPGHGPVADVHACAEVASYIRAVRDLARGSAPVEMPDEFAQWARPSLFAQNIAALRARPRSSR